MLHPLFRLLCAIVLFLVAIVLIFESTVAGNLKVSTGVIVLVIAICFGLDAFFD